MAWLKKCREKTAEDSAQATTSVTKTKLITLQTVKEKVNQLLADFGVEAIEQSCKWFLLWNNRYLSAHAHCKKICLLSMYPKIIHTPSMMKA